MTDWNAVPVFGSPGPNNIVRPSAYAVIVGDGGRVAIARTPLGTYLPGGGCEPGESSATTAEREAKEECGLIVRVGEWRAYAVEHRYSIREEHQFEKHNTFCDAIVVSLSDEPSEVDHELLWTPLHEAIKLLSPLSHQWAVAEWQRSIARR